MALDSGDGLVDELLDNDCHTPGGQKVLKGDHHFAICLDLRLIHGDHLESIDWTSEDLIEVLCNLSSQQHITVIIIINITGALGSREV